MATPRCPIHPNGRVVRAGWYGKAPHRRQRWLCKPPGRDAKPHRFSELLPRHEAGASHCSECSAALGPWEGQAGARKYDFHAREVAQALVLVANGQSYRQAALAVRTAAHRHEGRGLRGLKDGQLVSNWVDVFGPVVTFAHGHSMWPERIAVDSVGFTTWRGDERKRFYVMVAVGYEAPDYEPRLWLMRPYATKSQASWETFFAELKGTPRRIVADMDQAIAGAVEHCFGLAERKPDYHWCDLHVRRKVEEAIEALPQSHEPWRRLDRALYTPREWDLFVGSVEAASTAGADMRIATRWISMHGDRVRQQASMRDEGPYSTGATEAVNLKLHNEWIGERANRLSNRRRLIKLLDLLTIGYLGVANERAFATAIRQHLEAHAGRPLLNQREHDDLLGAPSLFA